jgi:hypothetical protein
LNIEEKEFFFCHFGKKAANSIQTVQYCQTARWILDVDLWFLIGTCCASPSL